MSASRFDGGSLKSADQGSPELAISELREATIEVEPRVEAPQRIGMLGATCTIGRATAKALLRRGHELVIFVRSRSGADAPERGDHAVFRDGAGTGRK